jgi:hypothetical protein
VPTRIRNGSSGRSTGSSGTAIARPDTTGALRVADAIASAELRTLYAPFAHTIPLAEVAGLDRPASIPGDQSLRTG